MNNLESNPLKKIVEALKQCSEGNRPQTFLCGSATGFYGDTGESLVDETASPGEDFLARVCEKWENEAAKAQDLGMRWISIRTGMVLSRQGGALEKMLPLFRWNLGGRLGSGRQWVSWIHLKDHVRLMVFCLKNKAVKGPVNAVSPQPIRQKDFAKTLAQILNRLSILPAPTLGLKLLLGEMSQVLLMSQKVSAQKIMDHGFEFEFAELADALKKECAGS